MFRELYEWIQNISVYLVMTTVVLYTLPGSEYKKYIRFFTGMVLILMILTPVFRLFGMEDQVTNFYKSREYETKIEEIENATEYLYGIDTEMDSEKGEEDSSVNVEEIRID
ncbi:MAG: stage III sporulation protein AF [Lachnospiraceae bacterium]